MFDLYKELETKYKNLEEKYKDLEEKYKKLKKEKDLQYLDNLYEQVINEADGIVHDYYFISYITHNKFKYDDDIVDYNFNFVDGDKKDINKLEEYIFKKYNNKKFFNYLCNLTYDTYLKGSQLICIVSIYFNLSDYIDKDTYYSNYYIKSFFQEYNEEYIKDERYALCKILKNNYEIFDYIEKFYDDLNIFENFKKLNDYLDEQYKIFINNVEKDDK